MSRPMNYIGKFISNFRDFYNDINTATLTGAIDVVVVEQRDGSFTCSPFHVRFGKMGVLRSREKVVDMEVNGEPQEIHMKLGESGEAFFVEELRIEDLGDEDIPPHMACSPIPSQPYLMLRHQIHETESCPEVKIKFEDHLPKKVSEKVRRISLVSGECRPIDSDRLEAEMGVVKPTPELEDKWNNAEVEEAQSAKWPEKPVEGARPNAGPTGKRKRRKKGRGSKKAEQQEVNEQPAPENIFVLDDLNPSAPSETPPVPAKSSASAPCLPTSIMEPMPNFLFFSDNEALPSPTIYPSSPTLSDSGMLRARRIADIPVDVGQSWRWGELPSPPNLPLQEPDDHVTNLDQDDEDVESGKGASLPHSPQGVDGGAQPPKPPSDAVQELMTFSVHDDTTEMSLCGGLDGAGPSDEAFNHGRLTFEDICANPKLLESPDLVVRLGTKYYNWDIACNVVMSSLMFKRPLPVSTLESVVSPKGGKASYTSWFSWGRQENKPAVEAAGSHLKSLDGVNEATMSKLLENKGMDSPSNDITFTSQSNVDSLEHSTTIPIVPEIKKRLYRKTLRLSSAQIASLDLKEGANHVMFSVTTAYQGTSRCMCHIYKWRYDDRIVISDIDGTITKSDVLGHILPIVGKDWAQSGVAQLFTKIMNNGYKLLYLSSRAIGQAGLTREYLRSIKQGDVSLPDGPLLLNPTSLVSAFHREVIERKPEEFKISCLRDILALFPADTKPFYAGYGNKVNDVWAYRAVGIPIFRIFTINHRGELKHEMTQTFQSSYTGQSCIVNDLFPIET